MGLLVCRRMIASMAGEGACTLRVMTTMSARRSAETGSRRRPAGSTMPPPNGSVASTSTTSASRDKFQVLETVVQHKPIDSVPRQNLAVLVPVRPDAELDFSGKPLAQQRDFVALRNATARPASVVPRYPRVRIAACFPSCGESLRDRTAPSGSCQCRRP